MRYSDGVKTDRCEKKLNKTRIDKYELDEYMLRDIKECQDMEEN